VDLRTLFAERPSASDGDPSTMSSGSFGDAITMDAVVEYGESHAIRQIGTIVGPENILLAKYYGKDPGTYRPHLICLLQEAHVNTINAIE
jgi:hypothetical protein